MAPKKAAASGFWSFAMNWRKNNGPNLGLPEVTHRAGEIWATMSADEKKKWDEFAKQGPQTFKKKPVVKYTSQGVPISQIDAEQSQAEKAEKSMKETIYDIVNKALNKNGVENERFIFISVNYFTKSINGNVYLPAEIALSEYSLKDGITKKFHTHINPGENIFGHGFAAKQHSESTHNLPLPPNAIGETDLDKIYQQILEFLKVGGSTLPPLYTLPDQIQATESVLNFLKMGKGCKVDLKIYNIHYLFYTLKVATCEQGGIIKPDSIFITTTFFERDEFEYHVGIGCNQHEMMDRGKYCSLSCVVRWGFMFSDYMCADIDLDIIPGVHVPKDTNCGVPLSTSKSFINESRSAQSDNESFTSFTSDGTGNVCKPKRHMENTYSNSKVFKDTNNNRSFADVVSTSRNDFDDSFGIATKIPERNRWAERAQVQAREPNNDTFIEMNSTFDSTTSAVYRRGRYAAVLAARSIMSMEDDSFVYEEISANTSLRSSGRGKLFN